MFPRGTLSDDLLEAFSVCSMITRRWPIDGHCGTTPRRRQKLWQILRRILLSILETSSLSNEKFAQRPQANSREGNAEMGSRRLASSQARNAEETRRASPSRFADDHLERWQSSRSSSVNSGSAHVSACWRLRKLSRVANLFEIVHHRDHREHGRTKKLDATLPCLCVLGVLCGENLFAIRNLNGANRDEYAVLGSRRMDCIGRWESDRADREIASQRHGRWAGIATREECCSGRARREMPRYNGAKRDERHGR